MQKRIKSAAPIYLAAAGWVIYGVIFPMYRLTDIVIAACVAAICYYVGGMIFRGTVIEVPEKINISKTGDADADALIKIGVQYIERLDRLNIAIEDEAVSAQIVRLKEDAKEIFKFVAEHPETTRKLNKFMDYYFPSCIKLLENYSMLMTEAPEGKERAELTQKIRGGLNGIEKVFDKQLQSLYSYTFLDISSDIDVLNNMIVSEGLGGAANNTKLQ